MQFDVRSVHSDGCVSEGEKKKYKFRCTRKYTRVARDAVWQLYETSVAVLAMEK